MNPTKKVLKVASDVKIKGNVAPPTLAKRLIRI